MAKAKIIKDKYGVKNVYLATDSYRIIAQTKQKKYKVKHQHNPDKQEHNWINKIK